RPGNRRAAGDDPDADARPGGQPGGGRGRPRPPLASPEDGRRGRADDGSFPRRRRGPHARKHEQRQRPGRSPSRSDRHQKVVNPIHNSRPVATRRRSDEDWKVLRKYLEDIAAYPILTPDREKELGRIIQSPET